MAAARREGHFWGVSGGVESEFVPKDSAGNRTAEQIDDAVTSASYNNMNQLLNQQAGGALVFKGTVSEPANVTVAGKPVTVTVDNRFEGQAAVPSGTGQVVVAATDPSGNLRTSTYQVSQGATSKSFTYDLNGNMTSDGTRTYEWDAENRLVAVKEGGNTIASYTYNNNGLRVSRMAGGTTTTWLLDGESVAEERASTGSVLKHFQGQGIDNVLGLQDAGGTVSYLTRDHLGSVREHLSPGGILTLRRDYDPWGRTLGGSNGDGWAFTGRERDADTGLYYYRARYYVPDIGAFLSEDPANRSSGGSSYAYASNAPVNNADPLGLYICRYYIANHTMACTPLRPGHRGYVDSNWVAGQNNASEDSGQGWSGCNDCQNNPARTDRAGRGPAPVGTYTIGPPIGARHKRYLTPWNGNTGSTYCPAPGQPSGRCALQLHWCPNPADCSTGCIADANPRSEWNDFTNMLNLEPTNVLIVLPGISTGGS